MFLDIITFTWKRIVQSILPGAWPARILWTTSTATTKLLAWCWLLLEVRCLLPGIFSGCTLVFQQISPFSRNTFLYFGPSTGVNHEELVGLAKSNFSGISFEYEGDAVPVLSPCRFTGSDVRYLGVYFIHLIWVGAAIIYRPYFSVPFRSVCVMMDFLSRTLPSLLKELVWPARTSSHWWWPTASSAAMIWPMVEERWVRGFWLI